MFLVAPFLMDWLDALKQAWSKLERYPLMQILKQRVNSVLSTVGNYKI